MDKRILSIFASFLILLSITVVPAIAAPSDNEKVSVIISFKDKPDAALVKAHGGDVKQQYTIIPAISADVPAKALYGLSHNPKIDIIELDAKVQAMGEVTPWGIERIQAPAVHTNGIDGAGIKVAIIDTGINYNHPDLKDNYIKGYDFVNGDGDPMDDAGHGTHVAGTVGAIDNDIGVIGAAPGVDLYALKVLGADGSGSYSNIISAIQWAVDNKMDVASMSLGGSFNLKALENACNKAYANGVVIVAAAGNDGRQKVSYPAAYRSVIAVAATDNNDVRARFSNYGSQIELSAPGVDINSTTVGGGYSGNTWDGTSMATPHVTGAVALLLTTSVPIGYDTNNNNQWDPAEVRLRLQDTATDLGADGKDNYYGYGLINAAAAVEFTSPQPISDTTAPVITLIGPNTVTIEVGTIYIDAGATANDSKDGDITSSIITVNNVINTTVGTYTVTYDVTDSSGNEATQVVRTVDVKDTTPPPAGDSYMHIANITMTLGTKKAGKNTFTWALATVTVFDSYNNPVPNAVVSGLWSDATSDSDIGTTDAYGMVTVQSNNIRSLEGTFIFTVTNVVLTDWTYNTTANLEVSDSITVP
ncbi:MAG: S8 family serine peptidase [Methanosarcinaceae archaeon]|nr:S8 family serine peptidase [Methanosarcinaceae archaeon]